MAPRRKESKRTFTARWDVPRGRRLWLWQKLTPAQLFISSFALLIVFGTLGLKFLPGLYNGQELGWQDALFTSTSAVCVTGLIVVDTATHFTPAGQAFLLLLIQLGGLGMLAFASLIIMMLGRRLSLRAETIAASGRAAAPHIDARRLAFDVVRFTITLEAIGAVALYALWVPRLGWTGAAWPAVFHSVSAFCNAGFSTFSDSLIGFRESPASLSVIMILVITGGIGFLTLDEVYLRYFVNKRVGIFRLSVHSKLVLLTTCVLLVAGAVLFAIFEWEGSLQDMALRDKVSNAIFMSVTSRTAGFNTIDYSQATDITNFLTILLMTVGGSPGSTAGGMKTTTIALLCLLAWSRLKGFETTVFGSRSIPDETIQRAVGLFVIGAGALTIGVFTLATTEQFRTAEGRFLVRMFEATSAFNTTGLSMGLTPYLSAAGRWTTILLMFFGRVGPLTLAAALIVRRPSKSNFRYAYEDVVVG